MNGTSGLNTDYQRRVSRQDMPTTRMQQIALRRHISIAQRQTFTPEDQLITKMATQKDHSFLNHQYGEYGSLPVYHYRQSYADYIRDNMSRNQEDSIRPKSSKVIVYRDVLNYNQSNMDHRSGNQAKVQRSVTFDLSMEHALFVSRKEGPYKIGRTKISKTLGQKSKPNQDKTSAKGNRRSSSLRHLKIQKSISQGNCKLKVKLNLNPLRRSQVNPNSGSNHKDKDVKRASKNIKKDKYPKGLVKKDDGGQKSEESPKKGKITEKLQRDVSSTSPGETQSLDREPEKSDLLVQSSAESTEPLGTANTSDPQVQTSDLNLAVSTPEHPGSPQKGFHIPQEEKDLPNDSMTPVSSTVSVVQEFLSSGDGSPKRKIRLIVPEKISSRPQTALEKKIR